MVSTPKPPDPIETASAQAQANTQSTIAANLVNNPVSQITPFGRTKRLKAGYDYVIKPNGQRQKIPRYRTITTLSKGEQAKLDQSNEASINFLDAINDQIRTIDETLSKPLDLSGLPDRTYDVGRRPQYDMAPTSFDGGGRIRDFDGNNSRQVVTDYAPDDFSDDRRRVERAIMHRLSPEFDQDRSELETRLVNQGLTRGSEAFTDAMDELRRSETDARMRAVLAGGDEQSRLLGEARASAGFENDALAQQFQTDAQAYGLDLGAQAQRFGQNAQRAGFEAATTAANNEALARGFQDKITAASLSNDQRNLAAEEAFALRSQPINEIGAAISGGQVNAPQFESSFRQGIQPPQVADMIYRSYEQQAANARAQNQGLFGLGGSLLGGLFALPALSDERTKENIERIGETDAGTPLYSFNYKGDPTQQIGPMAQEVAETQPEAVGRHPTGFLGVDYRKLH